MKTHLIIASIFTAFAITCNAQSDYSSYLNKTMEKLEAGDCEGAQKIYNVYKELSGSTVLSIEEMISDCGKEKKYKVGDLINVNGEEYTVAYTRDEGEHGFAIFNEGWGWLESDDRSRYNSERCEKYLYQKGVPTLDELRQIYANKDILKLYDTYWTCEDVPKRGYSKYYQVYVIDFSTGKKEKREPDSNGQKAVILLIHRF